MNMDITSDNSGAFSLLSKRLKMLLKYLTSLLKVDSLLSQ